MPEGPEVRMNSDLLRQAIQGKTLTKLEAVSGKLKRIGIAGIDLFEPSQVSSVNVAGKRILINLANGQGIISTLGMSGWWYPAEVAEAQLQSNAYQNGKIVKIADVIEQAYKHARVILWCEQEPVAVYTDMRNFGNISVTLDKSSAFEGIGFDILNTGVELLKNQHLFALTWNMLLQAKLAKSKAYGRKPLGEVALDQSFIAGLGNIYRAEALYISALDPRRALNTLTTEEWVRFGRASAQVLEIAYETKGVMGYPEPLFREHFNFNLPPDYIYANHLCYGRQKDVKGRKIIAETIGGRTMWYCPERQT